eukprot:gnl/Spiro4/25302_TR12598_c0_g1_i1.p1 gnl/Spiro4/25302_TR12598_c0_g1~~gnl/Spiro4/25302_TR12598_c0_g1_i1.p1  ORF type:complete len:481 (+),score=73.11 gnl/Spiro4/25302_TR12598_c0_g1_i1:35-1477(+)
MLAPALCVRARAALVIEGLVVRGRCSLEHKKENYARIKNLMAALNVNDQGRPIFGAASKGGFTKTLTGFHPFFAVTGCFDAHTGRQAASFVNEHLPALVRDHPSLHEVDGSTNDDSDDIFNSMDSILRDSFLACSEMWIAEAQKQSKKNPNGTLTRDGTSALVAVLANDALWVGSAGACRGVLSRKGVAHVLTPEHRPNTPSEMRRIEAAGGRVEVRATGRALTAGLYDVSRGVGFLDAHPYIIPEPEMAKFSLVMGSDDFFILATPGIFDVMTEQEAVDIVSKLQGAETQDGLHTLAAPALVQIAWDRHSEQLNRQQDDTDGDLNNQPSEPPPSPLKTTFTTAKKDSAFAKFVAKNQGPASHVPRSHAADATDQPKKRLKKQPSVPLAAVVVGIRGYLESYLSTVSGDGDGAPTPFVSETDQSAFDTIRSVRQSDFSDVSALGAPFLDPRASAAVAALKSTSIYDHNPEPSFKPPNPDW